MTIALSNEAWNLITRHALIILGCILFLIPFHVLSQQGNVFVHHLRNDFPEIEPWVNAIAADNNGFVWFGGDAAVQKFDGYSLKTYSLQDLFDPGERSARSTSYTGFLTDSQGHFWIFINQGLFIYHPRLDRFTRVCFDFPSEYFLGPDNQVHERISIASFMEDYSQNIWLGTDNGLLFYFPLDFIAEKLEGTNLPVEKIFLPSEKITPVKYRAELKEDIVPESLREEYQDKKFFCPRILKILQDRDGDIWVNTHCRLFRLEPENGFWTKGGVYFENNGQNTWWTKNMCLDREKNLWIGIQNYLVAKKTTEQISNELTEVPASVFRRTNPIAFDTTRNPIDFSFAWYEFPHDMGFQGHSGWIDNLHILGDNQLFIVNEESLINYHLVWNMNGEPEFHKIHEFIKKDYEHQGWKVHPGSLFLSGEGILFSSDWAYGVFTLDLNYHRMFRKLYHVQEDPKSLPDLRFSSLLDLGKNRLLFGGRNNTVFLTDYAFTRFDKYPLNIDLTGNIDNFIMKMMPDGNGLIWIRNYLGQMAILKEDCLTIPSDIHSCSKQIIPINFGMNKQNPVFITDLALDQHKTLWISTSEDLFYFDQSSNRSSQDLHKVIFEKFNQFDDPEDSTLFKSILYMIPVREDLFLLITEENWFQFNPLSKLYWKIENVNEYGIQNPSLEGWFYDIDLDGTIWLTDFINIFSITLLDGPDCTPCGMKVNSINRTDGSPSRPFELLADHHNDLWIYTETGNNGIVRYDPDKNKFTHFEGSGIINATAFGGFHGKDRSGRLYFGAMDGITVFHPDSVRNNSFIPNTLITDIKINHQSIFTSNDTSRLIKLKNLNSLTLRPFENVLTIEYSTLSYSNPLDNQYAYYLAGFDKDTVYTDASNRMAIYSNLSPGTYQFYINGSNNNGIWNNEPATLTIHVLPHWYGTIYAYILYILAIIGLVIGWRYYDLYRIRLQHKVKLEQAESEKFRQLDHIKTEFFSNISHEFRTPLTLILGPLENIIQGRYKGNLRKEAEIMKRNARRLLRLINQILSLSKLDAGKMKLQVSEQDLSLFIRHVVSNFESAARHNQIKLGTYLPAKPFKAYFDSEKMEEILENVVGNALKFTPAGGKVIIRLGNQKIPDTRDSTIIRSMVEISIQDTGIGIPMDDIDRIFDRFYQIDNSHTRKHQGAGIGLALVNELVKLHHGTIKVHSSPGKGTKFTILLPLGRDHFTDDVIVPTSSIEAALVPELDGYLQEEHPGEGISNLDIININTLLPLILVVEDNADMRHYITHSLDHQFKFIEAENGFHGFSKAIETIPDLIITDLMMPGLDGYELSQKIREDERTRHIPIIMLTAKAGKENLIAGYECGVDDYVIKPFDQEILLARIHNLLRERQLLREKFTRQWIKDGIEVGACTPDEKFIKKINEILELNYFNQAFGTRLFVRECGLSQSVLYRKLKALTNLSPNVYIRNYRLIKAFHIISQGENDISSAAYATGFNNLSYFSRSFKQLFKKSPHDFYAQNKV